MARSTGSNKHSHLVGFFVGIDQLSKKPIFLSLRYYNKWIHDRIMKTEPFSIRLVAGLWFLFMIIFHVVPFVCTF